MTAPSDLYNWIFQTGTGLHITDSTFQFSLGDYNHDGYLDLYIFSQKGASNSTEVHVLSGKNDFQSFLLHTASILHPTDENFKFLLGDYNHDGCLDLYAISQKGASNSTEVHVLSGKNNFQSFILQTGTVLHQAGETFKFLLGDYNHDGYLDLYAISQKGASNSTEVHVLSGKNNFQSFILQTGTVLHQTGENFKFALFDYNQDGDLDLYTISQKGASNSTEIHVLGGKNNFQSFILQTGTVLHQTDNTFEFFPGNFKTLFHCLYIIKRHGEKSTEVYIMKVKNLKTPLVFNSRSKGTPTRTFKLPPSSRQKIKSNTTPAAPNPRISNAADVGIFEYCTSNDISLVVNALWAVYDGIEDSSQTIPYSEAVKKITAILKVNNVGTHFTNNGISESEAMVRLIFLYGDLVYFYQDKDPLIGYMFFYKKNPSLSQLKLGAYRFAEAFRNYGYTADSSATNNYVCIYSQPNGLCDQVGISPLHEDASTFWWKKIELFSLLYWLRIHLLPIQIPQIKVSKKFWLKP